MSKSFRHNNVFEIFSFNHLILYSTQCQNQFDAKKIVIFFNFTTSFFPTQCQNNQKIVRYHDNFFVLCRKSGFDTKNSILRYIPIISACLNDKLLKCFVNSSATLVGHYPMVESFNMPKNKYSGRIILYKKVIDWVRPTKSSLL